MKIKLFILLFIPFLSYGQTYHDLPSAAFADAASKLNCRTRVLSNRDGQIEVSEKVGGVVYITLTRVVWRCIDPHHTIRLEWTSVYGEPAHYYTVRWWPIEDLDSGPLRTINTSSGLYDLPFDDEDLPLYRVEVEAHEEFDGTNQRSQFWEYDGNFTPVQ